MSVEALIEFILVFIVCFAVALILHAFRKRRYRRRIEETLDARVLDAWACDHSEEH